MSEHTIQCWSCGTSTTLNEIRTADGYCPECEVEIDLAEYYPKLATDYAALEAERDALADELDRKSVITGDYIARCQRLAAERDHLKACQENAQLHITGLVAERNAALRQRDKLAGLLREKFPRIDPHTPVPLNEVVHCCEYVLYQERERLHKVINTALSELTP